MYLNNEKRWCRNKFREGRICHRHINKGLPERDPQGRTREEATRDAASAANPEEGGVVTTTSPEGPTALLRRYHHTSLEISKTC